MGDPASSYSTAGIALRILEALKPPHPDLPILCQGGDVIEGQSGGLNLLEPCGPGRLVMGQL